MRPRLTHATLTLPLALLAVSAACDQGTTDDCGDATACEQALQDTDDLRADAGSTPDAAPVTQYSVEEWLEAARERVGGDLVIVDARSPSRYESGHLEGALSLPSASLRSTVEGVDQLHPADALAEAAGAAGVTPGMPLLVYADATDLTATHLFWALEVLGHDVVALLDGGFDAWTAAGLPVEKGPSAPDARNYPADGADPTRRVEVDYVLEHLDDPEVVFIDARSDTEYAAGHIPGAVHIDWQRNVAEGRFVDPQQLAAIYEDLPRDATLVTYCQTGSRASMAYFVLRKLNYPDVRLYDGSWSEWSADPSRPVE